MAHKSDNEIIQHTHNTARFFVEHRQVALVLLLGTFLWGWFGYSKMPKRKDPVIPVRVAVASCKWPGASAEDIEQLVTRPIEQAMAQNQAVKPPSGSDYGVRSLSFPNFALVFVQLDEKVKDTRKELNDINLRLNELSNQLPKAQAHSIQQQLRRHGCAHAHGCEPSRERHRGCAACAYRQEIDRALARYVAEECAQPRISVVVSFPQSVATDEVKASFQLVERLGIQQGAFQDSHLFEGPGFIGIDVNSKLDDAALLVWGDRIARERFHRSEIHPDSWRPALIRDPGATEAKLSAVAGEKYSYRELDDFTALIQRTLQGTPEVSKVDRSGVLAEKVYLDYSQQRLAEYGVQPSDLSKVLSARNSTLPAAFSKWTTRM
jgi:hypothetical protein